MQTSCKKKHGIEYITHPITVVFIKHSGAHENQMSILAKADIFVMHH